MSDTSSTTPPRLPIPEFDGTAIAADKLAAARDATEWMIDTGGSRHSVRPHSAALLIDALGL